MTRRIRSVILCISISISLRPEAQTQPPHLASGRISTNPASLGLTIGNARAIVLFFVASDCPVSNRQLPEMLRIEREFVGHRVRFYFVYPNTTETAATIRAHRTAYAIHQNTLADPRGIYARLSGANVTPEAAVLIPAGPALKTVYAGRIDDRYLSLGSERPVATRHDLEAAITAALANHPVPPPGGPPVGCAFMTLPHQMNIRPVYSKCPIHRALIPRDGWDVRPLASLSFVLALAVLLTAILHSTVHATDSPVTYSRQIAPILYKNCSGCHHIGGSGPFPLTTYAEAKRWASTIETVTQSRYMPPWLPESGHGDFADPRRMTPDEITLLKHWVDAGAPEGNPAEAPAAPSYKSDWQLGAPDLVLEVESPMQVPASGTDLFRNFILPFPLKESKWIRAMEIKPGAPRVVHHANLILDRAETLRRTHPHDWQQGIPGMDVVVDAGEGFDPDGHFLDWKPDSSALVEPAGMAWRLDPGNDLVLNMHLKPTGKPETIRARIGLYFTANAPTKLPILIQLEHDAALNIPAGDARFVVEDKLTLPVAVDVLAIYPHAHYLGKRLEGWADLPGGVRTDLILIPNWDIDRQSIYRFAAPVSLPAGATIHMRYSYDNSAANPHNPNSPPIRVTSGNRSVDEMGHLWLQLLPYPDPSHQQDLREPILRAWMQNVLEKSPTDPTALFNLASLDMSEAKNPADFATAAILYKEALKSHPNDARMRTALAAALLQSGDEPQARAELLAAIAADPTYPDAPYNLALIEAAANRLPEAISHLQKTIALEPANLDAHHGLVALFATQNRLPEAIDEQKMITTLAPNAPDEWNNLGALMARSGDATSAIAAFHRALTLDPANAKAQANLAHLQAKPK